MFCLSICNCANRFVLLKFYLHGPSMPHHGSNLSPWRNLACDHFRNHIIGYVLPSVKRFHVFLQPLAPRTKCKTESRGVCLTSLSQPCIKGRRRSWSSTFFRFNHTTLSYLLTITKPNSCVRIFLPGSGGNGNGNASYRKK